MKRLNTSLLILLVVLLSACGSSSGDSTSGTGSTGGGNQGINEGTNYNACPGSTNTTAAAAEDEEITLTVSYAASSPAEDALVKQNLDGFTKAHPKIKLNISAINGDYTTKMRANISAGNVADVFYLQPNMSSGYISAGKLLNLVPYMTRDNVQSSDFYGALMTPFSCKDGHVFGLPKDWNTLGVFYNKKMFQEAGIAAPTAKWTWDDMSATAKKLTKAGNAATSVYGITLAPDASRWGAFLYGAGGTMLNQDGTQAAFNSQAGIDSLKFYTGFQKDGSSVMPAQVSAGWAGDAFGKQRAAMALEGGWLIPYLKATYPDVQYDIAPLPVATGTGKQADLIFTNAWAAYSGSKHPDAAWQLIKYMTGETVQTSQLHAGFALPTLKSLANDPYFTEHPGSKVMFDAASYGYADYFGPQDAVIHDRLQKAIEKVLLGTADVETALKDAASQINNELQV